MSRKSQWIVAFVVYAGVAALVMWWVWPPPVSREQAIEAIRAFEGNDKLNPEFAGLINRWSGAKIVGDGEFYIFRQMNASPAGHPAEWYVNCVTGEVSRARHQNRGQDKREMNPIGLRTEQQCRAIAEAYARAKYREFDTMGFKPVRQEWSSTDAAWMFFWEHAGHPFNRVCVYVSPVDGSIVEYRGTREPGPGEVGFRVP